MLRSKFSFTIYLNFILLIGLLLFILIIFIYPESFRTKKINAQYIPWVAVALLILILVGFYTLLRFAHIIKIKDSIISIKGFFTKETIDASSIKSINLFAREDFYWSIGTETVAINIILESGKKIIIADPFYSNINKIKEYLYNNFSEKIVPFKTVKEERFAETEIETSYQKFSGNPFTSLNGIMILGFFVSMLITLITLNRPLVPAHFFVIFPVIGFYLALGLQLHYFLISNQRLIVKNHFIPWIYKSYNIADIAETNFETPRKRSQSLRITTKDFKSKAFSAGSLREKNWNDLKEKLKSLGIYFVEV